MRRPKGRALRLSETAQERARLAEVARVDVGRPPPDHRGLSKTFSESARRDQATVRRALAHRHAWEPGDVASETAADEA